VTGVSLYQLHRCVFDFIRSGETKSGNSRPIFDASRYQLTESERAAFEARDVAALYRLGLHPVLLNAFCRAAGYSRDDYRKVLAPYAAPEERKGRWRT
jgi:hypothetical protein